MNLASDQLPPPPIRRFRDALFLDFDGTLVELAETPESIRVPAALPALVERVRDRLAGRLAIVSGRSIANLQRHLGRAELVLSGSHGLELRLPGGSLVAVAAPEGMEEARRRAAEFAAGEGLIVEHKPAGLAIHYRQSPEREEQVRQFLAELADMLGLEVQPGKMVAELRPAGADKGDAVRRLMAEPQFASARPLFVGDDLTDENGFAAAAEMGGAGILVGKRRPTAARWRLPGVAAVIAWLEASAAGEEIG